MTAHAAEQAQHRSFLNRYYGISRHFYDLTRKYYLFGRDKELTALLNEEWHSLVEIGPGTGRNLKLLKQKRPSAFYGGIEASDEMLKHAEERCDFAHLFHGFAENCNISQLMGHKPDRILFAYCLSMVSDPQTAINNALSALGPQGEVVVVDFADFSGFPRIFAGALNRWLQTFHVRPVAAQDLENWGARVSFGPGRYFLRARFPAPIVNQSRGEVSVP